jgi:hypothetical protein
VVFYADFQQDTRIEISVIGNVADVQHSRPATMLRHEG